MDNDTTIMICVVIIFLIICLVCARIYCLVDMKVTPIDEKGSIV